MTYDEYLKRYYETGIPKKEQEKVQKAYWDISADIVDRLTGSKYSKEQSEACVKEGLADTLFEYGSNPELIFSKLLVKNLILAVKVHKAGYI